MFKQLTTQLFELYCKNSSINTFTRLFLNIDKRDQTMPSENILPLFNCGLILRIMRTKFIYTQRHKQGKKVLHNVGKEWAINLL